MKNMNLYGCFLWFILFGVDVSCFQSHPYGLFRKSHMNMKPNFWKSKYKLRDGAGDYKSSLIHSMVSSLQAPTTGINSPFGGTSTGQIQHVHNKREPSATVIEKDSDTTSRTTTTTTTKTTTTLTSSNVKSETILKIKISRPGINSGSMLAMSFFVALVCAIIPPTFLRSSPLPLKLFMLPFWFVAGLIGKKAVINSLLSTTLSVGNDSWCLKRRFLGKSIRTTTGKTVDLESAICEDHEIMINGIPKQHLRLVNLDGRKNVSFGFELSDNELERLSQKINNHLEDLRAATQ